MTKFHYCMLIILGFTFATGCGDSNPQPWEGGKAQASGGKTSGKSEDVANNDATDQSTTSEPTADPHAGTNPHASMQKPSEAAKPAADSGAAENDGKLEVGSVHWVVPKTWITKRPNMMLKAEYGVPHAEGDTQDARLTVSQVGGSVKDNFARWKKQFGDKPDKDSTETIDVGGVKVTLLDLAGTFDDPGNMTAAPVSRPDYHMIGATFEIPGEQLPFYIKCYGPAKTMTARGDEIKAFIRSMKVDK